MACLLRRAFSLFGETGTIQVMRYLTILLLLIALLTPNWSLAAEARLSESFVLPATENLAANLYALVGNLELAGPVSGDVFAAAGRTDITAPVQGDLFIASGNITVSGPIYGDVRVAGGTVEISGEIAGDLAVAGGQVHLLPTAKVKQDVLILGGAAIIDGAVVGSLRAIGGKLLLNGPVLGPVTARVDELSLGERAALSRGIKYQAPQAFIRHNLSQVSGPIVFNQLSGRLPAGLAVVGVWALLKFLTLFAFATFLYLILPRPVGAIVTTTLTHFGRALGMGVTALILVPALVIILALTVVGVPLALFIICLYVALLIMASVFAGLVFGAWLERLVRRHSEYTLSWWGVLGGTTALFVVSIVPFVGWLIGLILFVAAFGGLAVTTYHLITKP